MQLSLFPFLEYRAPQHYRVALEYKIRYGFWFIPIPKKYPDISTFTKLIKETFILFSLSLKIIFFLKYYLYSTELLKPKLFSDAGNFTFKSQLSKCLWNIEFSLLCKFYQKNLIYKFLYAESKTY